MTKPLRSVIRRMHSVPTVADFLPNSQIILDCSSGQLWHLVDGVPTQMSGGGAQGPEGPMGPQGPQGIQGPQGLKGDTGNTGPQGPQGVQGPQGLQGNDGPQGLQGIQGPAGADGAQGPAGNDGPQGPQGPEGPQGPQGEPGAGGAVVKSGLVNLTAGGSANVVFVSPFSSTPHVTVLSQINNADTSCTYSAHSVTVNGFTIRGAGNPAGNVAWIATNAGNA
jgi:hypothetical protein